MTYEYRCRECGHEFSIDGPMGTATNPEPCPECGGPGFRVYKATPVHFKGKGFTCACAGGCGRCERDGDGAG